MNLESLFMMLGLEIVTSIIHYPSVCLNGIGTANNSLPGGPEENRIIASVEFTSMELNRLTPWARLIKEESDGDYLHILWGSQFDRKRITVDDDLELGYKLS